MPACAQHRRCIAIIAEGVPELHTREIISSANNKDVMIIGPATVGGIKPGVCSEQHHLLARSLPHSTTFVRACVRAWEG
jgi:succinyl-CoA synthetase alpha subunit